MGGQWDDGSRGPIPGWGLALLVALTLAAMFAGLYQGR